MVHASINVRAGFWLNLATREACYRIGSIVRRMPITPDKFEALIASGEWRMIWDPANEFDGFDHSAYEVDQKRPQG